MLFSPLIFIKLSRPTLIPHTLLVLVVNFRLSCIAPICVKQSFQFLEFGWSQNCAVCNAKALKIYISKLSKLKITSKLLKFGQKVNAAGEHNVKLKYKHSSYLHSLWSANGTFPK